MSLVREGAEFGVEVLGRQQVGSFGNKWISLMHRSAFGGMRSLMYALQLKLTEHRLSNINAVDSDGQTPLHHATIADAILVAAALMSSITFQGWLQQPLELTPYSTPYSNHPQPHPAPPGSYESYAAVNVSLSLRASLGLNDLAFFFSLATVLAGENSP